MGVEYILINKTKKEYISLGKYLQEFESFQFGKWNENKKLAPLLMQWEGDLIQLLSDATDPPEDYVEIDNFHSE